MTLWYARRHAAHAIALLITFGASAILETDWQHGGVTSRVLRAQYLNRLGPTPTPHEVLKVAPTPLGTVQPLHQSLYHHLDHHLYPHLYPCPQPCLMANLCYRLLLPLHPQPGDEASPLVCHNIQTFGQHFQHLPRPFALRNLPESEPSSMSPKSRFYTEGARAVAVVDIDIPLVHPHPLINNNKQHLHPTSTPLACFCTFRFRMCTA
jgi:hypothetical protein